MISTLSASTAILERLFKAVTSLMDDLICLSVEDGSATLSIKMETHIKVESEELTDSPEGTPMQPEEVRKTTVVVIKVDNLSTQKKLKG